MGSLEVRFEVGRGRVKLPPLSKNLLELRQKLANCYASTHTNVGLENIPFSTKALLILLRSAFFCKNAAFFGKNSTFSQSNNVRAVLEVF